MTRERLLRGAWWAGIIGLAGALLGWWLAPAVFPLAWLGALTLWIGWPLGCLALLFAHALTGGRWGETLRPHLVMGIATLPLLLPALVPLLCVAPHLYPWLQPDTAGALANRLYLNTPFAIGRGFVYLIVWFELGALALRAVRHGGPSPVLAVIGLGLLGVTVTFASIDATMSLDPHFVSSAYGMMTAAEAGLLALAISVLAAACDAGVPEDALDDLGRLLQGLLVLFVYLDFMQFLIIWQSDLPREAAWYVARSTGPWGIIAGLVALGHFLLPFFALMSPRLRRSRAGLGGIACLLIAMEVLRAWWLVLPAGGRFIGWIDIAAMLAIGGLATGAAISGPGAFIVRRRLRHG
jgi:hypothetical protein